MLSSKAPDPSCPDPRINLSSQSPLTPYKPHPIPCILHPKSSTLHPTPFTLHPPSSTLNVTSYALHPYPLPPAPYTARPSLPILNPTHYILTPVPPHPAPYEAHTLLCNTLYYTKKSTIETKFAWGSVHRFQEGITLRTIMQKKGGPVAKFVKSDITSSGF